MGGPLYHHPWWKNIISTQNYFHQNLYGTTFKRQISRGDDNLAAAAGITVALAVVIWRLRCGGGGWGGDGGGRMAKAARRWWLRCGGRNGKDTVVVAVVVWRKRRDGSVLGGGGAYQKINNVHCWHMMKVNLNYKSNSKNQQTKREPTMM